MSNTEKDNATGTARPLKDNPIHLGLGAKSIPMTSITGAEWYGNYEQKMIQESGDEHEGRLVSYYTFSESWDMWEMHPHGSEVVLCTKGQVLLLQEQPDGETISRTLLNEGEYVINEPGVWHTADCVDGKSATVLFITAGKGTKHKPRNK